MPKKPVALDIRGYQVGFGDCFLLSFKYDDADIRHVLVDFGSMGLPKRGKTAVKPSDYMPKIAEHIAQVCNGKLTAVVATHRHADHINGFGTDGRTGASGAIIKALKPRVVLQPWTEDPHAARDAKRATTTSTRSRQSVTAGLRARQNIARMIYDIAKRKPKWMSASLQRELEFLGMENIANKSAVDNLIAMGKRKGARAVYARYGSKTGLERLLPGVKITVLGPPDLTQTEKTKRQRSRDPDQFWHLLAGDDPDSSTGLASGLASRAHAGRAKVPIESRWFRSRLDRMRGEELLEIVRSLDSALNNTSLILLIEVFGKKLLFPGDAQIENWSYALVDAEDAKKNLKLISDVDVLKVGHHGSLNATPRKLVWEALTKRGTKKKLKTLLSTMPGKHGKTASKTEVPRRTLLNALSSESELLNTDDLPFGAKNYEPCYQITVKP